MSDATEQFFHELGRRGYEPLWARVTGTVRVDVVDGNDTDAWIVAIDKGNVTVSQMSTDAGCTVRVDKPLFEELARGEANAMAAVLRGAVVCTGDVELLFALQRIFPGPPDQRRPDQIGRSTRWEP